MSFRTVLLLFIFLFIVFMFHPIYAGRYKKQGHGFKHLKWSTTRNSEFGLWPSSFNLATKAIISANATCGENGREEFCRMIDSGKGRCGICDNFGTDPGKKHTIEYAIDGSNRWWQSPALFYGEEYEYVTIIIDLKQIYQITDVIVKSANSLRPGTWILERSLNGNDFEPWQYFARNDKECFDRFGIPSTKGKPHYFTDTDIICTSFYSKLTPMENGEIHTSLINGRPGASETSPELLEFTKARYVRLRLMGLRGKTEPLPRWLAQDALKEKRLFYTIRDISIIGHCVCNGHAENCRHNVASGHPECECAHHTCGPNCDKCCPMYNQRQWGPGSSRDAHQCLPCNCHGHAMSCHYDENVDKAGLSMDINGNYQGGGVCDNCTAHTTGVNCERCISGYYQPHGTLIYADKPCVKCDCDFPGSVGTCVQEGISAGNCECLLGYDGEKCEYCAKGFKGWPNCVKCPCDSRGIGEMADCEGDCKCKTNVAGKLCDQCKSGYFALSSSNPQGCTQCYCSGVTTVCETASISPQTISTLENWLTTDSEMSELVKPIRDNKGIFSIGSYELIHSESLYWLAPEAYLGNKLEYYGSTLTYKVHWVIMRGDTSGRPTLSPNIIIIGANGLKIAYGNDSFTMSNTTFNIEMVENGWYRVNSNGSISRSEFLGVLSNVSHVLLRATFHTDQIESLLEEAVLHSTSDLEVVEKCSCPSGYTGLSCETCSFGYVRITTNTTPPQTFCGKCDCNGHSDTCNPDTGECKCLHNTIGENCERCKAGFYGNPLRGTANDCRKCACPLENDENNFSPSCQLDYLDENGGDYVCTQCPKGYTGDHCEICDDGYFGNPMEIGNDCKPCNCNGGPCDKITGQCLSCKGNTEGWRCEKCKTGYYGNALMSNCISCQCDPIGSISTSCDVNTGQCQCKDRFTERTCNKCEVGYGNVTALCTKCSCNPIGSKSDVCDQHTGLCECKKGVDGFHCDTCENLHYGLSEAGCKECNCDKYGSKIAACDQNTGKCMCKPHYEGTKCDLCKIGYWKSNFICKPCNCNYNGSTSLNCDSETGKCSCKPGVQGQRCDSCQEKHYGNVTVGCKACDVCDKQGHICHPENGKCVCPKLTKGAKCEHCVENAWGYEPGIGCKSCDCSPSGSSSFQCDNEGRCTCKVGFEGEKCDKCSFGHYNYPYCRKCDCALEGTKEEDCINGLCKCHRDGCKCKANVEGRHCDRCKEGFFGLDSDHPEGCIPCFCSNRSTTCTASTSIWRQITSDDVRKKEGRECINKDFCWQLSSKFTGDLMDSYGGYLTVASDSPRNFVYLTGNGFTLKSITDSRGDIKMMEPLWKFQGIPSNPSRLPDECVYDRLTRPCLMIILQNVTKILVEPSSNEKNLIINEVLLDRVSTEHGGLLQAKTVEKCICPNEYTSSSCQDPNKGYYRHYPNSHDPTYNYVEKILGVAKPCQCNNKSSECDKQTGYCLNCREFTRGIHCESCAEGYYRNAQNQCSPCQCPSENQNFAKNCTLNRRGTFTCICKPGYKGTNCNKCEDQYWGNPQYPGGSCQPCNCNPHGSESLRCNKSTGKCQCKKGFTGDKCSKCESPREVIQDGVCLPCDECTQILFHHLDELSQGLNETLDLFKGGLGPPWGLLNDTFYQYKLLNDDFDNLQRAERIVKKAKLIQVEKKIQKLNETLQNRVEMLEEQANTVENINQDALNAAKIVQQLNKKVTDIIESIDNFGKSHVNVNEALREAEELLKAINTISEETPYTMKEYRNLFEKCQKIFDYANTTYIDDLDPSHLKTKLETLKNRILKFNNLLDKTELNTKHARNKNKQNRRRINDLKRSINELKGANATVEKNVSELLKKINATNDLLDDLSKIYQILARLKIEDAGKNDETNLDDVYNSLSNVRQHITNLQTKTKTYKNLFNFTPEEWTKIDATGAYKKILEGVTQANFEAEKARNITVETLQKLYPDDDDSLIDKTNLAKAFSDRILKRVTNLQNLRDNFSNTNDELENLKHAILFNGKSNNELNSFLRKVRKNLTDQYKNLEGLEKAKSNAKNASSLMESIKQGIKDIDVGMQYELGKTYAKYLNLVEGKEVEDTRSKMKKTQKLINQIDDDNTLSDKAKNANRAKLEMTTEKINELREKISRLQNEIRFANEQVAAIRFSLNVKNCQRNYKLKNDIFRSLEITFQCKKSVLVRLFDDKNRTITVSYQDNKVSLRWRNQNITVDSKNESNRETLSIIRRGTKIQISTNQTNQQNIIDGELFIIDRIQIGDSENSQDVCIHEVLVNKQTVSLWKFTSTEGTCSACSRNTTNSEPGAFFNGNSYQNVLKSLTSTLEPQKWNFDFDFATFDENSLIFLALDRTNLSSFIALYLENGHLELKVKHINGDGVTITTNETYNDGIETKATVALYFNEHVMNQSYTLSVRHPQSNKEENTTRSIIMRKSSVYKIKKSDIFIGGIASNRSSIPVDTNGFAGNLKVLSSNSLPITIENSLSYNVEPRMPKLEFYQAWFSGEGFVNLEFSNLKPNNSEITFLLKPVSINNNFVMNINGILDISLKNSNVIFKLSDGSETDLGSICINSSVLITIKQNGTIKMNKEIKKLIDSELNLFEETLSFYLGDSRSNETAKFIGTISDIFLDNTPLLFNATTVKNFSRVEIGRDRVTSIFKNDCETDMQSTERYFIRQDYPTEPQAFKFGDKPNSFVSVKNFSVGKKFSLEFQFRTFYPDGLLLYANTNYRNTTFFTILEIQGGDIRLRVQGHRIKTTKIKGKVNNGDWHLVQLEQVMGKKKMRLVVKVDKKFKIKERTIRNNFNGEMYFGGLAKNFSVPRKLKNDVNPLRGCIRSLKINRNLQVVKNNNVFYNNIGQCFQNVEEGAYFGGDAYAIYKYDFKINKFLELSFEFKTGASNGILLSISNDGNSPALSVELQNGAVVMTIDMGNGVVSQVTNSPHQDSTLANNVWHNITALYSSSELTVNIDGIRKSWVQSDMKSMMDEIEAPLYIGGIPSNVPSGTLKIKENFIGCIRKFQIEDTIMDWTDMKELNNVQLNSCFA